MNILIFGATGGTGRQVVAQGLSLGHRITAFVRNPARLAIQDKHLMIVQGNILDSKDIDAAMKDQVVVISVLGNKTSNALWKSNMIISDSVKHIISSMKKNNVKRLVFVASFGVNKNIFLPEKLFIRIVLKNIFADIPRQEALIRESGLDWTIVHPARLVDTSGRGIYRVGENLPIGLFSKIARSDVADFLLKNIDSEAFLGKTVTISY